MLSVIAILAGILTPRVIQGIDRDAREAETRRLAALKVGLIQYVETERALPGTNDWVNAIASYARLSPNQIGANPRGNPRRLLVSTNFWADGSPQNGITQPGQGWAPPVESRYILLSSLDAPLPNTAMSLDELWNLDNGAALGALQGWTQWTGRSADVLVERIDLSNRFHRIVLHNDSEQSPSFTLDGVGAGGTPNPIANPFSDFWTLGGTELRLRNPDTSLAVLEVITESRSYYFHQGAWRRAPSPALSTAAGWLSPVGELLIEWFYANGHSVDDLQLDVKQKNFTIRVKP